MTDRIFRDFRDVPDEQHVVTIGNFDGVHRGHQYLLNLVATRARKRGVRSSAVTFDPLPAEVLRPDRAPKLLTTSEDRFSIIASSGIDTVVPLTFTHELANQSAEAFIQDLVDALHPVELVVGADFAFGHRRQGTPELLEELGPKYGFDVSIVGRIADEDEEISSSRIRDLLASGEIGQASRLLSRPYSVRETVIVGNRRGRDFGFPTANLRPDSRLALPPDGIYAAKASIDRDLPLRPAVVYVGTSPTFDEAIRLVEVNLLDFSSDIYGRELTVLFVGRIRGDARFDNVEELIRQMHLDKQAAIEMLEALPSPWPDEQAMSKLGIRSADR